MYVEPSFRRAGLGQAILKRLVEAAASAGYAHIRLDSPDFMTAAHALYRRQRFVDTGPYAESEIPDEYKAHWVFMERRV
jgi:GNAT superfamily N-acetyltransferase